MENFKIKVSNETKKRRIFNLFTFIGAPCLMLMFYFQDIIFNGLEDNTKNYLTLTLFFIAILTLGLQLRKYSSDENVSVDKDEIITSLLGKIKKHDIDHIKLPLEKSWNKDIVEIKLKNGSNILFSPIIKQFRNKKNILEFEKFKLQLKKSMSTKT